MTVADFRSVACDVERNSLAVSFLTDVGQGADTGRGNFHECWPGWADRAACDARHNKPRIGRILMARGRDATDVAIVTSFGPCTLASFKVITQEVTSAVSVSR